MKQILYLISVVYMLFSFGCSTIQPPTDGDIQRTEQTVMNDYTFITGKTSATSWGDIYLNADIIGYGNLPIKCGDYVYFIQYLSDMIPPATPPKNVPVKYDITTGTIKQLAAPSSGFDLWNIIDATLDGTLMIGKFSSTSIFKNGSTIRLSYVTNAELSDDGNWLFYVQNNKAYRMNLVTKAKTLLCANGYVCEVATDYYGTKALIVSQINGKYAVYMWNGSGLSTIGDNFSYYCGIDMSSDGIPSYSVNGYCYWWNGTANLVGMGFFPAIKDGVMLFGNNGNLNAYYLNDGLSETIATYNTAVQQIAWGR